METIDRTRFGAQPFEMKPGRVEVQGWLFSKTVATADAQARLRISDEHAPNAWEIEIAHWSPREDVVSSLGGNAWDKPGFAQLVDFGALPPGAYRMTIVFKDSTQEYSCDNGRELLLK